MRASHILLKIDPEQSTEEQEAVKIKLEGVLKQAQEGVDFAKLAKQHSQDGTAEKGGDLGFFKFEEMVPSVAEVAFSLETGGISGIVRSPFGFHLVKTTEVEPAVQQPMEAVREKITEKLSALRAERKLGIETERPNPATTV